MAEDLNSSDLVGRPTRDPEVRETAGGTKVANIRLAFSTRTRDGEEWVDKSNYITVTVFGRTAEFVEQYVTKGKRIGVDARLEMNEWTAQDGSERNEIVLIANKVFLLDSRRDSDEGDGGDGY